MKRIVILTSIALLLGACFHSSAPSQEEKIEGFTLYSTESFNLQIPSDWETLTRLQMKSDVPENTTVAFRNNLRHPRFTANIVVLENQLSGEISTFDYAKAQYQKLRSELLGYREILAEKHTIKVSGKNTESVFIYVEGKTSLDADVRQFMQVSGVKGKRATVVMGSFLPEEMELVIKKMETAVKSLAVK